ncbi:TRAP transporter substrate-binding protein [Caballeronia sp. Lep1P3]|uniref:TRAP transporter substrate-binding protein n=1 Tax=Caballeronia sp. Lep1P3 TaxID=2878150 RepID=UPI001FD41881|nr:TRAP transporter substrate-binding protein [Caballeronia sp. Lep1P3]
MTHRTKQGGIDRRSFLKTGAAIAAAAPLWSLTTRNAFAADFSYKLATGQDPTHPVNIRAQEACDKIRAATGGKLDIKVFPANQLGSDTDLLSQVRSGGVEFFNQASSILATLTPAAGIVNTGFAFPDYGTVWKAMDGDLGGYIRAQIEKSGIIAVSKPWDNGFRQISSSTRVVKTPADLKGFKIRVPQAPMLTSLFKSLDAGPAPINFNELYSALQTGVVEGQENPLPIIATAKLYEVQKSISLTSHVWDAYWILGNRRAWQALPPDMRAIVTREFEAAGMLQRADIAKLNGSLRDDLKSKGINMVEVDREAFRGALKKTSFYSDWKAKYGEQAWSTLEKYTGKLV